jgi:hypothetical protein
MLALALWLAAPLIGDAAPGLALPTLDGKAFAGLDGQITVIEFFATGAGRAGRVWRIWRRCGRRWRA